MSSAAGDERASREIDQREWERYVDARDMWERNCTYAHVGVITPERETKAYHEMRRIESEFGDLEYLNERYVASVKRWEEERFREITA